MEKKGADKPQESRVHDEAWEILLEGREQPSRVDEERVDEVSDKQRARREWCNNVRSGKEAALQCKGGRHKKGQAKDESNQVGQELVVKVVGWDRGQARYRDTQKADELKHAEDLKNPNASRLSGSRRTDRD
jgi:hypothetical protein